GDAKGGSGKVVRLHESEESALDLFESRRRICGLRARLSQQENGNRYQLDGTAVQTCYRSSPCGSSPHGITILATHQHRSSFRTVAHLLGKVVFLSNAEGWLAIQVAFVTTSFRTIHLNGLSPSRILAGIGREQRYVLPCR